MGAYPELSSALPASFGTPSRTSRILRPGIVLATVALLAGVSLLGLCVAAAVLSSAERTKSTNALQAFVLIASLVSIIYIIVHGVAAKSNDQVGAVRPPQLKLHAACFILARLALVSWVVAFFTACAVASKSTACTSGTHKCKLQIADIVASIVGWQVQEFLN
ncbi:hypothetical protein ONS96_000778 [Cadophora gregata f. sp. sojae]|nr:hypothetical protein ONS96_000778 [Cadophora gregata f. sp. sojae]